MRFGDIQMIKGWGSENIVFGNLKKIDRTKNMYFLIVWRMYSLYTF